MASADVELRNWRRVKRGAKGHKDRKCFSIMVGICCKKANKHSQELMELSFGGEDRKHLSSSAAALFTFVACSYANQVRNHVTYQEGILSRSLSRKVSTIPSNIDPGAPFPSRRKNSVFPKTSKSFCSARIEP